MPCVAITIVVSDSGTAAARTLAVEIILQGKASAKKALTLVEAQEVREMASKYQSLLQEGISGREGYLPILADILFRLFLKEAWPAVRSEILASPGPNAAAELTVASALPEVLQIPWEIIGLSAHAEGLLSQRLGIVRCPTTAGSGAASALLPFPLAFPGPLSMLFSDAGPLDVDSDEEAAIAAGEGLDAYIQICESGASDELKALADSMHPHLVILVGQAKIYRASAVFSLPGRGGAADSMAAEDLAAAFKEGRPSCVILAGRQREGASALHLLAQKLAENIPSVLIWDASAASACRLLRPLSKGCSIIEAVSLLRDEPGLKGAALAKLYSYPALYTRYRPGRLFDSGNCGENAPIPALCQKQPSLPGTGEGRTECFVGRRTEMQRLSSALVDGRVQSLIITGPDGCGKSTMASWLASHLAASGYRILSVYGSRHNGITAARLIDAAASFFRSVGQEAIAGAVQDSGSIVRQRLERLLEALRVPRTLLIWDGLRLDEKSGKIPDPDLAEFYLQMNRGIGNSRAAITCRALPADAPTLPAKAWQWKLEGLSRAAFARFLLMEEIVAKGYRKGEITFDQLAGLHSAANGLPALLAQTAKALGQFGPAEISGGEDFVARLALLLDEPARMALFRAAVFDVPINSACLAAVSGATVDQVESFASRWQQLSLAFSQDGQWLVPGPVRRSLLSALSPQEQQASYKAAGDALRVMAASGRSEEITLGRLDALMEARGLLFAAGDSDGAAFAADAISGYLLRRGYYQELIRLNQEFLAYLESQPQKQSLAAGPSGWIGRAHLDQEEYRQAEEWYSRALQISEAPSFYHCLGLTLLHLKKIDEAIVSLQKAAQAYQAAEDLLGQASALGSIAAAYMKAGRNEEARVSLTQIAGIMKAKGDVQGEAAAWQDVARLDMMKGDYDRARPCLVASQDRLLSAGDMSGYSIALFNLASLDLEKGDFAAAREEFERALPLFVERGDESGASSIQHSLGMIYSQAGESEKAKKSFQATLAISQKLGDRAAEAGAFFQLGVLAVQQNRAVDGLRLMALAAVLLRAMKSDDVKNVEPLAERLAAQLGYSQEQFQAMVQEILISYAKDRGRELADRA